GLYQFKCRKKRQGYTMKKIARSLCPPLFWNLMSNVLRKYRPVKPERKIVHGVEMLFPPAHTLPSMVSVFPRYDTLLPEFLQFLREERPTKLLVVDVGANVGDTAALAAAKVGADNIRFICLEADEQYLPFLKTNVEKIDAQVICAVIGSRSR